MAIKRFRGDALTTAQVTTVTIGVNDVASSYFVTINGKAVGTGGQATAALTAASLQSQLAASASPEFREITWTVLNNVVTGTARTAGKPFTLTTSVIGGTGTIANATTTANSGPSDISVAGNWSPSGVPIAADDVYFDEMGKADALYGLNALTAIALTSFNVIGYTKKIGLPEHNGSYFEYRPTHLEYQATTVNIDSPLVGRCKLRQTAVVATMNVRNTGSPADQGQRALMLKGSTITTLVILKGDAGLAKQTDETLTVTTLRMGHVTNINGDARVFGGTGLTVGTIDKQAGELELRSGVGTSLTNRNGNVKIQGTGAVAQLYGYGGTCIYNTTGALGGATVVAGTFHLDFSQDPATKTVTNPIEKHGRQSRISDPNKVVTGLVVDCNQEDITGLNIGQDVRITRGVPA